MPLAASVSDAVNSWPAVVLALITIVGGWGTLIIKTWIEARKAKDTGETVKEIREQNSAAVDTVKEIKDQVVNGHASNLRDDVTEGLELMRFAVGFIKTLPTQEDIRRMDNRLDVVDRRLAKLEQGGTSGGRRTD